MDRYQNLLEFFENQKKETNYGRILPLKDFLQRHETESEHSIPMSEYNYINMNSLPQSLQTKDEKTYFMETKKKMEIDVLKKHKMRLKTNQDDIDKNYSCKICNKLFKKISHVKSHMQTHIPNRKKHKCNYCNAEFLYISGKVRHEKTHKGHYEICTYCSKKFKRRYLLNSHLLKYHVNQLK